MKASLAQAERRPDELKEAMEKLGQAPPSGRQLFVLRLMGLISPPEGASALLRVRGFLLLLVLIVVLLGIGTGIAELISIPAGGWPIYSSVLIGFLIVAATLGILALVGRRRQRKAREDARAQRAAAPRR